MDYSKKVSIGHRIKWKTEIFWHGKQAYVVKREENKVRYTEQKLYGERSSLSRHRAYKLGKLTAC